MILGKGFGPGIRDLAMKIGLGYGPDIRWERLDTTSQRQETSSAVKILKILNKEHQNIYN
jgi:hypothetical protein